MARANATTEPQGGAEPAGGGPARARDPPAPRGEEGGGLGVLLSKLTDLQLKSNRMLNLGNVLTFRWYFTGPQAFGGILRKS